MKIPLEISYRGIEKTEALEELVRQKADKLDEICDYLSSCRVTLEQTQTNQQRGRPYRVRLDITVPPGHEIAVRREQTGGSKHESLETEIRSAFDAAMRQVKKLKGKQNREVKQHPEQMTQALVSRLFRQEGYGFIRTLDGRDIYFHRNSLPGGEFDRLEVGTGVNYTEEMGQDGPQATTVRIVDKPGVRVPHGQ
jgi:cold shock CspA family protein